jgi:aminoglycoside phosphotransferase
MVVTEGSSCVPNTIRQVTRFLNFIFISNFGLELFGDPERREFVFRRTLMGLIAVCVLKTFMLCRFLGVEELFYSP